MAKQTLNIGSSANDGTGTTLRAGGDIINDNFNEIYTTFGDGTNLSSPAVPHKIGGTNFTNSFLLGHSTTGTLNSAEKNTGVGIGSLDALTSGDQNVGLGYQSLTKVNSGGRNIGIGHRAGENLTTGSHNTYVGDDASRKNVTGQKNVSFGSLALQGSTGFSHSFNSALGSESLKLLETGGRNIGIGYQSGDNITTGSGNVIIGSVDAASATGDRQLKIAGYDGSTTTTWLSGDNSGNLTTVGDVTLANNKKVIFGDAGENISGDGTLLTVSSSNNIHLDAASQIHLDANSTIKFMHFGTNYGEVERDAQNLSIKSALSDGDILLKGNDGGSTITALTLDMSDAGSATFNNNVNVGGNATITGNLTVNGTTTTVNSTNTTLDDNLLELNSGATSNANDSGIIIERGSTGDNAIIMWDESADKFTLGTTTGTADSTGNISVTVGELVANINGSNSTLSNVPNSALAGNGAFTITGDTGSSSKALGETIAFAGGQSITTASNAGTITMSVTAGSIRSTELASASTLLILDSSGSTLKTIIGAGS